jgi:hypothetical protein
MPRCTNEKVFLVAMDETTIDKEEVIILVIKNFLGNAENDI